MPGKRYRWKVTRGPYTGSRVRILRQAQVSPFLFEVQLPNHQSFLCDKLDLKPIRQKTTRPKGRQNP